MDGRLLEANVACICNGRQIQIGSRASQLGALGGGARDKIGPPLTLERAWRKRPDEHEASSFKAKGMGKKKLFTGLLHALSGKHPDLPTLGSTLCEGLPGWKHERRKDPTSDA